MKEDLAKHILVVEDEGLIAADIQRRLERLGYPTPDTASSGEEALNKVRSTQFDLILMDIRLKGAIDGITTAGLLKAEFRAPLVYMTAHSDLETVNRAKLTEPLGYLLKPITDGDLRSTVQVAIYKHEMERRVRASEAWLWTTLRSVGEAIVATDADGAIFFMNPLAEQLTGWPQGDAQRLPLMDVLSLRDEATGEPALSPVLDLVPDENRTYTLVSRLGVTTPVEVSCFENRAAAEGRSGGDELLGAILVVRDIRARRELEARLIQSQRMEAIANLAGGLAHDFNNQLMVIAGYADELSTRLSGETQDQAVEIKRVVAAAGATTTQLLTLGRRDVPRLEVLNIEQILTESQPLLVQTLGDSRTLAIASAPPHGFIRADRHQLQQVLLNLAIHSRDVMPSGTELRLESSTREIAPDTSDARLYRPGTYVALRIAHNGQSLSPATLAHIFEPSSGACNLALPIVHSIVAQTGGYISARSEAGQGTSFEILLPCLGTFLPRTDATTVLLVEDEDGVRRLMHKFLERGGYQILEARNGEDAAAIAQAQPSPIQVLVADVAMNGMSGTDLAKRLQPQHPEMKALFVSGYRHHTVDHESLWKDGLNLLPKPFPAEELLRRVQLLLR